MDGKSYSVAPSTRLILSAVGLMLVGGAAACGIAGYQGWGIKNPDDYWDLLYVAAFFGLPGLFMLCAAQGRLTLGSETIVLRRPLFPTRRLELSQLRGYTHEVVRSQGKKEFITFHGKNGKKLLKLVLIFESPDEIRAWVVEHLRDLGAPAPQAVSRAPAQFQAPTTEEPLRAEFRVHALKLVLFAIGTAICLAMLALSFYCLQLKGEFGLPEKAGFLMMALLFGYFAWIMPAAALSRLILSADEICVAYPSGRRDSTLLTLISGYAWALVEFKGIPVGQSLVLFGHDGKELRRINIHYRDSPRIRAWVARHLKPFDDMKFSAETARRG